MIRSFLSCCVFCHHCAAEMLNLTGIALARFPSVAGADGAGAKDLFGYCMYLLRQEFRKTVKPDFQAIWGSLLCLDSLLLAFPAQATADPKDNEALFA